MEWQENLSFDGCLLSFRPFSLCFSVSVSFFLLRVHASAGNFGILFMSVYLTFMVPLQYPDLCLLSQWIDVTDDYALARGAGGGFGLWRKVDAI